jgi:hypothetical protein
MTLATTKKVTLTQEWKIAIAKALSDTTANNWVASPMRNSELEPTHAEFKRIIVGETHPAIITIRLDQYTDRIEVYGNFWTNQRKHIGQGKLYEEAKKSISMTVLKLPYQIAKDINNRFLGRFLPAWDQCVKWYEDECLAEVKREQTLRQLKEIIGLQYSPPESNDTSDYRYKCSYFGDKKPTIEQLTGYEIDYHSNIKVTLSLNIEQLENLATLLKDNQL